MTAPQEPLVMTLEEAVEALYPVGMELRAESLTGEGVSWSVFEWSKEENRLVLVCTGHDTWWEAVSDALGRPVVARDDAAELRAAAQRFFAAFDAFDHGVPGVRSTDLLAEYNDARTALRAALAATEEEA